MFINFTNHPSPLWSPQQMEAARRFGEVIDMPFPNVPPEATEADVARMAAEAVSSILVLAPAAVLCQGEMTLTYRIVRLLSEHGIPALAACSERITTETVGPDGTTSKISRFEFRGFRRYE